MLGEQAGISFVKVKGVGWRRISSFWTSEHE